MVNIRLRIMGVLLCEDGRDKEIRICTSFGMYKAEQGSFSALIHETASGSRGVRNVQGSIQSLTASPLGPGGPTSPFLPLVPAGP